MARFLLALSAFMCYASYVHSETSLNKECFNMATIQVALPVVPTTKEAVPAAKTKTITQTTYRNPVSHTHTCSNPRCRFTWDHAITVGHNCPKCGSYQNIQDTTPKMIQVTKTIQVPVDYVASTTRPVVQAAPQGVGIQFIRYGTVSSNCPNGQCSNYRR